MRGLSRWRQIVPAAVVLLVAGSLTASALTSPGYHRRQLTLDDGSIWTSQAASTDPANPGSFVGRANPAAGVIDTAVAAPALPQLLQDGANVIIHDAATGAVTSVDTVLGTTSKPLTVPALLAPPGTLAAGAPSTTDNAGDPRVDLNASGEVGLGADTVAVVDQGSGRLYLFAADALPAGRLSASTAAANVARDSKVVVGVDGIAHVVSPAGVVDDYAPSGRLLRHSELGADLRRTSTPGSPWSVTAVGDVAVVLDGSGGVYAEGSRGSIASVTSGSGVPVLQQPAAARPGVLLETASALVSVALRGGAVTTLATTGSGSPTAPVFLPARGCSYAAWDSSPAVPADASSAGSPARAPTTAVRCDDGRSYDGPGEPNPVWRVNHGNALLNDEATGANIYFDALIPQTIADWTQAQRPGTNSASVTPSSLTVADTNSPALPSTVEHAPTANADFAATRPGLPVIVPVLRNDTDPDGDLLSVSAVTQPPGGAVVSIVDSGGAVQVVPASGSLDPIAFTYTIDDGRRGTATAPVTVAIHPVGEDLPPVLPQGLAPVTVAAGGRVTLDLLQNVTDPDGDAVTLAAASLPTGEGSVSITGAGLAVVSPAVAGDLTLRYTVVDGHGGSQPGTQPLSVKPPGTEVAPLAHDDRLEVTVGRGATIDVLANDLDASAGPLRITTVTAPPGLSVTAPTTGTGGLLSVIATSPGTSLVRYTATDGEATSSATLRVDAVAADAPAATPVVAVRDDATVRPDVPTLIPVLANDLDAAGSVLVIDGLAGVPAGLTVIQNDHATLTVRTTAPLTGPESFTYTASDGVTAATGTVVVRPAPTGVDQPPVTAPFTTTVRAGNATELDVLAGDFDPEGETISLSSVDPVPAGEGSVFVEAGQLRYLAPPGPVGAVSIDYTATDTAGNDATGSAVVHVTSADAPNHPPEPTPVTARVFTGAPVTVALPVEGIDPDGDVTTLVSVTSASPTAPLGTVTSPLGLDRFTFTAGDTGGTQLLDYKVRDSGGLLATGIVSIGVADPPATDTAPVALPDTVSIAPGASRAVAVLGNDSDADGDQLTLDPAALTRPSAGSASIAGDEIVVTAPAGVADGTTLSLGYGISDGRGGTATSTLTETVTSHGQATPPVALDDLTPAQRVGAEVSVPVLANDVITNGTAGQARVAALAGSTPTVTSASDGTLHFVMPDAPVTFGYTVTDAAGLSGSAVVRVPVAAGQPPVANPDTATTPDGQAVTLNLTANDSDPQGLALRVVTVTPGTGGAVTVASPTSARFTPGAGFSGLATFGYTVSDGPALRPGSRRCASPRPTRPRL